MEDPTVTKADDREGQDLPPQKAVSDLKSIRESKGLTLKNVFERSRISVISLDAIEKEEFHLLPPPVIARTFIRNYARLMGLDGSEILARYEQYLETLKTPSQKEVARTPSDKPERRSRYFLWVLAVLAGVSVIVFLTFSYKSYLYIPEGQINEAVQQTQEAKPPEATGATTDATGATKEVTVSASEEKDLPSKGHSQRAPLSQESSAGVNGRQGATNQETKQQPPAGTYPLTILAKELTWVRVKAGQEPPQDVLLKPGEKIERTGSKFVIDLGNAGGVSIDFQGKSLGEIGKRGHVVHLKLP